MPEVRIRPFHDEDAQTFDVDEQTPGTFEFRDFRSRHAFRTRFAEDGMLREDRGDLAVVVEAVGLVGLVGWTAIDHGPAATSRALRVHAYLFPQHRGKGFAAVAQAMLAGHLFAATRVERLEAVAEAEDGPAQRAAEKAGFQREGVLRHALYRDGAWRDLVLLSRLRDDA